MPQYQGLSANQPIDSPFEKKSFRQLLDEFKASMKRAFHEENDIDQFCSTRGLPPAVLQELMSGNPLALCIPSQYGQESIKPTVFGQYLNNSCMGGLMITEPGFGSDALSMHTSFTEKMAFFISRGRNTGPD
ncbi:MAG: hypothetical protein D4R64_02210 [Porphyromonadaceae bacterium]|nr:MAG: hypothetical protein D4R64_02210 [Porphyromonadaceae bacterium]